MRKILIFIFIIALTLAGNALSRDCGDNPTHSTSVKGGPSGIKNAAPTSGDILVADYCDYPEPVMWTQQPEDCDGDWSLLTSDTDLGGGGGYFVYDDYSVNGAIEVITIWWADLLYHLGWNE
ncbi:MAG: hypothetical protein GF307_10280 [candidate division Zixibacteria bacterium]|nr:hypothetical protein [candidate division Zixibacteria bacterium]